jgi:hypothetical protein
LNLQQGIQENQLYTSNILDEEPFDNTGRVLCIACAVRADKDYVSEESSMGGRKSRYRKSAV